VPHYTTTTPVSPSHLLRLSQSMSNTSRKHGAPFRPINTLSLPQKPTFHPQAAAKGSPRDGTDNESSFAEDLSATHLGNSSSLFEDDHINVSPLCVSQPCTHPIKDCTEDTNQIDRTRRSRYRKAAQARTITQDRTPWCENESLRHRSRRARMHMPPPPHRCLCRNSRPPRHSLDRPAR
jgi:hypothetical protein